MCNPLLSASGGRASGSGGCRRGRLLVGKFLLVVLDPVADLLVQVATQNLVI
jgi:hypothetical protein